MSALNKHFRIRIYSHCFVVDRFSPVGRMLAVKFAQRCAQYELVNTAAGARQQLTRMFAASPYDRREYRFHINQLSQWREHLLFHNYSNPAVFDEIYVGLKPVDDMDFSTNPKYIANEEQVPLIEYSVKKQPTCKLIGLRTGGGKTVCALLSVAKIRKIPCIVIKPAYIDKWIGDLMNILQLKVEDIMVIQGSKHLTAFMTKVKTGELDYKAVIMSNRTYQLWIKLYEKYGEESFEMGYEVPPEQFYEHANVGIRLIDEVHQDFHLNFKIDLYTNVEYALSLSATLITRDPFLQNMYEVAYPLKDRCAIPALKKYVHSYAVHYGLRDAKHIRTSERGSTTYSHGAFEKSIIKNPVSLQKYLELIDYVLAIGYLKSTKIGKSALIFAYSIDMCTIITNYLKNKYKEFKVNRYVENDPYSDLMDGDMVVSTLGSSGTAIDKPNLTNVALTTAIDSLQSNVQSLGRLRELDGGATKVEFHYFVCDDVQKHLDYHYRKVKLLDQRAKTFMDIYTGINI